MVFRRWACEQVDPGEADPHPGARAIAFGMGAPSIPGALQRRCFAAASGESIVLEELADWRSPPPPGVLVYRAYAP